MKQKNSLKAGLAGLGVIAVLTASATFAQRTQNPAMKSRKPGSGRVAQALNLTPEQTEKLQALQQAYRAQLKELRDSHEKQVRAILTPEQAQKLDALKAQRQHGRRGWMRGGMRAPGSRLNLTPQQQSQVRDILRDARQQQASVVESAKKSGASRDQVRAELNKLRAATRERISQVLTPEQRAKLSSRMVGRPSLRS